MLPCLFNSLTRAAGKTISRRRVGVVGCQKRHHSRQNRLGQTRVVGEKQLRAGTLLASCGIAYAMRYIRAASEGGVEIGFRADDAKDIVLQTVKGAVALLQATGEHPEQAIDRVTTPGGITIRGLNAMEQAGFTKAVVEGLKI